MLGGVSLEQVLWVELICLAAALAAGAWGVLVAFWREKTFQTLAISVLGSALFIGLLELGVAALGVDRSVGRLLSQFDPYRAVLNVLNPLAAMPQARIPRWAPPVPA